MSPGSSSGTRNCSTQARNFSPYDRGRRRRKARRDPPAASAPMEVDRLPMSPREPARRGARRAEIGRRAASSWSRRRSHRRTPLLQVAVRPAAPAVAGALRLHRRDPVQRRAATFFKRQPEMTDPRPSGGPTLDLHRMDRWRDQASSSTKVASAFCATWARNNSIMGRKLRLRPASRLVRRRVAARSAPAQRLVDVRHAHPEQRRGRIHPRPAVHRRQHPIAKVLPDRRRPSRLPPAPIRSARNQPANQPQSLDSARPENALGAAFQRAMTGTVAWSIS